LAGATVEHSYAGDASAVGRHGQPDDVMVDEQRDIADGAKSRADVFLDEGPGREIGGERRGAAGAHHQVPTKVVVQPGKILPVQVVRTIEDQLIEDPWEQFLEYLGTAGQQAMQVPALRHTPASRAGARTGIRQRVALHHRNGVVELAQ
jgi:hypothetical protein